MPKSKKKNPGGRPPYKITQEVLEEVEKLAFLLLNEAQIADCLGICQKTLIEKKKKYSEFVQAIKRGRAKGLAELASDLRKHQKNTPAASIFKAKVHLGWKEDEGIKQDIKITIE